MVWVWRVCLGGLIAAYAGWLLWPLADRLATGGTIADLSAAVYAEAARLGWARVGLWLAAAVLYLASAVLTGAGIGAAPGAYFLAFGAEVIQRLLLQSGPQATLSDTPTRIAALLAPLNLAIDPGPLALAILLAVGMLVLMTGVWRGHKGHALTRHWTQPPLYA